MPRNVTAVVDQSVDRHQVLASGRQQGGDQMTEMGKIAARMGRRVLMSLPAVVLAAGTAALLPLGTAAANASPMHGRNTLTVATTGSDSGNCQSSPCKTLGYALTQAGPNNKIVIYPGSYPELWQRQRRQTGPYGPHDQIHRVGGPHGH